MIDISKIPQEVMEILKLLRYQGYTSFFVGGSVRDLLLGKDPKDFDICTAATPEQVKEIFAKVINTGLRFGTVTVLNGTASVEVTTFRKVIGSESGDTEGINFFSNFYAEDVKARDFTINGILFDGEKIIDLVDGLNDLRDGSIRAIGNPGARFEEDALRMIRGIRLHGQLGFAIEEDTYQSIIRNAHLIQGVAPERIRDELSKILVSDAQAEGFRLLLDTGLLKYVLPELVACRNFDQKNPHHDKDVFDHIMAVVEHTPNDLNLRLSALLHDIGKPQTFSIDEKGIGHFYGHNLKGQEMSNEILTRLKFDRKTIGMVGILVREHMSRIGVLRSSTIKKLINRVGVENIYKLIDLQIADLAGSAPPHDFKSLEALKQEVSRIIDVQEPFSLKNLAIGGRELQEIGFQSGPEVGRVLNILLNRVLKNPQMNNKVTLIRMAQEIKGR